MWGAHLIAQIVSLGLSLVEKKVFNKVETFSWKVVHSSPIPCLQNMKREIKMTFLGKKLKIFRHLAKFAENDGGVCYAKPQIFWTFQKHFQASLKKKIEKFH